MSIEQKIAELLEESKKAEQLAESLEEVVEEEIVAEAKKEADAEVVAEGEMPPALKKAMDKKKKSKGDDEEDDDEEETEDEDEKDMKKESSYKKKMAKESVEVAESEELIVDVSEDVAALLNGEELSEDFQAKAKTIFETVVINRVKTEVARLKEEIEAETETKVEAIKEGLVDKVDGYLNYVVEQWIEQNEIALESGMKSDILEGFVSGLKTLFTEHYIEVPEEKFDVLGDLKEQVSSVESKLDEQVAKNVAMASELNEMKRKAVIAEAATEMTDVDREKFMGLIEELSFEDSESFAKKVSTIRENYFAKKATKTEVLSVVSDEPVSIDEDSKAPRLNESMSKYADMLNRSSNK
jgi:hypothetical protein